jgi:hypothetical protein
LYESASEALTALDIADSRIDTEEKGETICAERDPGVLFWRSIAEGM